MASAEQEVASLDRVLLRLGSTSEDKLELVCIIPCSDHSMGQVLIYPDGIRQCYLSNHLIQSGPLPLLCRCSASCCRWSSNN